MKGTGKDSETFFIIAATEGYWHFRTDGSRIDCWGDPLTAERFDTQEEAETFIDEEYDDGMDGYPRPSVLKVVTTVEVTECGKGVAE